MEAGKEGREGRWEQTETMDKCQGQCISCWKKGERGQKNEMVEIKSGRWGVVPAKDKDKSRTVSMNGAIGGDS